jgi:protein involved in polysaccharide export with SLBB domain
MFRGRTALVLVWLAGLAGCSTSGGQITLFPAGHRLIEPARVLREISGPPPEIGRELDKRPAPPFIVEPGDVLLAQPAGLGSSIRLPGDQPVLPDGTIKLGRYGPLLVAGKTVEQIEVEVNERVAPKNADDRIVVRLVSRESKVYYVLGEVNAPGAFQLKGRETVLDAIVTAGGLNSNASRRNIILVRPTPPPSCRVVLPVQYNAIVQLGDTTTNYQIKAGDRVYVPSRCFLEDLKTLLGQDEGHGPATPCFPAGDHAAPLPPPFPPHEPLFLPGKPEAPAKIVPLPAKAKPPEANNDSSATPNPTPLPPPRPVPSAELGSPLGRDD